jgi:O-antigen ligase
MKLNLIGKKLNDSLDKYADISSNDLILFFFIVTFFTMITRSWYPLPISDPLVIMVFSLIFGLDVCLGVKRKLINYLCFLLPIVSITVSTFFSFNGTASGLEFIRYMACFAAFTLGATCSKQEESRLKCLKTWYCMTMVSAIINIAYYVIYAHQFAADPYDLRGRANIGFTDPNHYAFFLGCSIFLFLQEKNDNNPLCLNNFLYIIPLIIALLLTKSRAGISSFVVCFTLLYGRICFKKVVNRPILLFLLILVSIIIIPSIFRVFSEKPISFNEASTSMRFALQKQSLQVFIDHPIFGVGPGALLEYITYFKFPIKQSAHNSFLLLLAELGVIGSMLFAIPLIYGCYRRLRRSYKWKPSLAFILFLLITAVALDIQTERFLYLFAGILGFKKNN